MTQVERELSHEGKAQLVRTALDHARQRVTEAAEATAYLAEVFREYVEDDDDTIQRAALLAARLNREIFEIHTL